MALNQRIEPFIVNEATFLHCEEQLKFLDCLEQGEGFHWTTKELSWLCNRKIRARWDIEKAKRSAEQKLNALQKGFFKAVMVREDHYPKLLKEIYDPPFMLSYRGSLNGCNRLNIAIVGTRVPDGAVSAKTWELAFSLGKVGIPIVSGLALGIDSFAHSGNHGGECGSIAVLGSGVDQIYPKANKALAIELVELGGALISEYPLGTPPAAWRFPQRNRIISGISPLTVVIQAPKKSGALITTDFALEQGREVALLKAGLVGERGSGTAALAESGAAIIETKDDILNLIYESGFN